MSLKYKVKKILEKNFRMTYSFCTVRTFIFFIHMLFFGTLFSLLVVWLFGGLLPSFSLKFFTISSRDVGIGIAYSLAALFVYSNRDTLDLD